MNLYVGDLSPGTTQDELLKAFAAHGEVSSVSMLTDRMKDGRAVGSCRGYGFVEMPDDAQAQGAIAALHNREIHGKAISVRIARPGRVFRHRR